jgi:hypothetical protein
MMKNLKTYEKVVMTPDELDDGSVCINFDVTDDYNLVTRTGGYVMARQDNADNCFYVSVFDAEGNVLTDTVVPFKFINHEDA